jgi:hypothetical protein
MSRHTPAVAFGGVAPDDRQRRVLHEKLLDSNLGAEVDRDHEPVASTLGVDHLALAEDVVRDDGSYRQRLLQGACSISAGGAPCPVRAS